MDRLAVLADRVLMADYKTNRRPPARVEDTPVLYLRQMAAYRAVLRGDLPGPAGRAARWSGPRRRRSSMLPDALLDLHAPARLTADPSDHFATEPSRLTMSENTKPVTDQSLPPMC